MYCKTVKEIVSGPVDYKDENNNVYLMEGEENEEHYVEFKSILLDVLEKEKTFQRITEALEQAAREPPRVRAKDAPGKAPEERVYAVPSLKPSEIRSLSEGLLFRFRKCSRPPHLSLLAGGPAGMGRSQTVREVRLGERLREETSVLQLQGDVRQDRPLAHQR